MNILFVSKSGDSVCLAERVKQEGHNSYLYILEKGCREIGEGMVDKPSLSLPITTKNGTCIERNVKQLLKETDPDFVVFDMVKMGEAADYIRSLGVSVFGACMWADYTELDRAYGYKLMKAAGITVPPTKQFKSGQHEEAIRFVEKMKKRYVYKPSGNIETSHTYVSSGVEDMVAMLALWKDDKADFELQEYVDGIEVSCELWWNGLNASIYNMTFEEKRFMDNNVGPTIGCAGNIVKMTTSTDMLVVEGIGKMERLLKKTKYRGPIDLNAIVTKTKLFGLEFTVRFGYDAVQALLELYKGSLTKLLYSVATGSKDVGEFTDDFAIAVRLSIPPYPHTEKDILKGVPIIGANSSNLKHIWMGDVMKGEKYYESAGAIGAICAVSARGRDVNECRRRAYRTIDNLTIPQLQYRSDIGERVNGDMSKLKKWGYL